MVKLSPAINVLTNLKLNISLYYSVCKTQSVNNFFEKLEIYDIFSMVIYHQVFL
jgi:hypothetical protein